MLFGWKGDCFIRTLPDSVKREEAEQEAQDALKEMKRAKKALKSKIKETKEAMKPPNMPGMQFDPAAVEAKLAELGQEITLHEELQGTLLEIADVETEMADLDTRPVDMPILIKRLHLANAKKAQVEACMLKIRCTKLQREKEMIQSVSVRTDESMLFHS